MYDSNHARYYEALARLREYVATATPESSDIILATQIHLAKIARLQEEVNKAWMPIQNKIWSSYKTGH